MADDRDARIAQLEAELRRRDAELRVARAEIESRDRAVAEALEQQTATAEVLRIISGSPTHLEPVLAAVAEKAAIVCGGEDAHVRLMDEHGLRHVAAYGTVPGQDIGGYLPVGPGSVGGLAVAERRTVHVSDLLAEPKGRFSASRALGEHFAFDRWYRHHCCGTVCQSATSRYAAWTPYRSVTHRSDNLRRLPTRR